MSTEITYSPPDTVVGVTSVVFGATKPYVLRNVEGIGGLPSEPATARGPFQPGSTLLDNRVSGRRFSVQIMAITNDREDFWDKRNELSHAFSIVPRFDQRNAETGLLRLQRDGRDDIEISVVPEEGTPRFTDITPHIFIAEMDFFAPSPWWENTEDLLEFFEDEGGISIPEGIVAISGGEIQVTNDWTFTGPADRTRFDSNGIMQTVTENEARTTYIDGVPLLWIDGAVEEISGRSFDLDNWTTVNTADAVKNAAGLDGQSNTAWTVTDGDSGATESIQNNTTVADDSKTRYLVFAVEVNNSPSVYSRVGIDIGGGTTPVRERVVPDPSDGSLVESFSDGEIVLSPIQFNNFWLGVISVTNNGTGNTTLSQIINPAINTDGSALVSSSVTGSTIYGYCGVFTDNFSLMPILTTGGTTKSLAAEVASLTNSIISNLTEGVIYMEIWSPQLTANAARHIAELESDANNFIRAFLAADGDIDAQITDGGASQAALAGPAHTPGTLHKVALSFGPSGFALYVDGTQSATGTGTVPSVDTLLIGAGLYGGIKTMNVHTSEWSQSTGEAETT